MAAAVFPTSNDDRAITILEKGIIIEEDAVVGAWVDQFDKLGLSLHSIEGAKLCRQALEDARIRRTLETVFPWSGLILFDAWAPSHSGKPYCFRSNSKELFPGLVVHLWSANTKLIIYKGSQHLGTENIPKYQYCWEVPLDRIKAKKISSTCISLKKGGLTIMDSQLAHNVVKGFAVVLHFVPAGQNMSWSWIDFSDIPGSEEHVNAINSATMGLEPPSGNKDVIRVFHHTKPGQIVPIT